MYTQIKKTQKNKSIPVAHYVGQRKRAEKKQNRCQATFPGTIKPLQYKKNSKSNFPVKINNDLGFRGSLELVNNLNGYATGTQAIQRSQIVQLASGWDFYYAAKDWLTAYWNTDGSITGTINYIEFLVSGIVNLLEGVGAQVTGLTTESIAATIGGAKEISNLIKAIKDKDKKNQTKAIAGIIQKVVVLLTDVISIIVILSTNTPYGYGGKLAIFLIKYIIKAITQFVQGLMKVSETKSTQIPSNPEQQRLMGVTY